MAVNVPIWLAAAILAETPDSGSITFEGPKIKTRIYRGPYDLAVAGAMPRGTWGTGDMLGWVVMKSQVDKEKGGIGRLTITWEATAILVDVGGGPTLPGDEFDLDPFEISPRVESHPHFKTLTGVQREWARTAVQGSTDQIRSEAYDFVTADPNPVTFDLFLVLDQGEETYYLSGQRYSWSIYTYYVPDVLTGGFIETPGGPLAGFLSADFDWLRQADKLSSQGANGGLLKLTRTWIGAPSGHWTSILYP